MNASQRPEQPNIVLAITGASGVIYALRLLEVLVAAEQHVHLSISASAVLVLKQELGIDLDLKKSGVDGLLLAADAPWRAQLPAALAARSRMHCGGRPAAFVACAQQRRARATRRSSPARGDFHLTPRSQCRGRG